MAQWVSESVRECRSFVQTLSKTDKLTLMQLDISSLDHVTAIIYDMLIIFTTCYNVNFCFR